MTFSATASDGLVGRANMSKSRGVQNAALGMFALVVSAAATVWVIVTVVDQHEREAARMIVDAQKGSGYLASVVNSMAVHQGRPRGH